MDFKNYKSELDKNLPPNLDTGTILRKVLRIEQHNFPLNGKETKGMRVFALDINGIEKEFRTSSGVLMSQFEQFFKDHPNETLENVKVVSPKGKNYLTLEEA